MPNPPLLIRTMIDGHASSAGGSDGSIGPVTRHRIALVRRRLARGAYPLAPRRIAEEIHAYEAGTAASHASGVAPAVIARIEAGIHALAAADAMILQLEFIEGFSPAEIAATLRAAPGAVEPARRRALDGLCAALVR